jgi:hypothetical protein
MLGLRRAGFGEDIAPEERRTPRNSSRANKFCDETLRPASAATTVGRATPTAIASSSWVRRRMTRAERSVFPTSSKGPNARDLDSGLRMTTAGGFNVRIICLFVVNVNIF